MVNKKLNGILVFDVVGVDLVAGQVFNFSDEHLNNFKVKIAIKQGYLVPVETDIKINVVDKPLEKVEISNMLEDKEDLNNNEKKTKMASWDAYKGKLLDKNESVKLVSEQMKSSQVDEVKVSKDSSEIDFTKDEEKTEKKKRGRKAKKQAEVKAEEVITEIKLPEKSNKSRIKRLIDKAVEDVDAAFVDSSNRVEDISFVDQEQEADRIKKHNLLSKKNLASQNGEVS